MLIACAHHRQTITYGALANAIDEPSIHANILDPYLNRVYNWTMEHVGTDLTVVVVNRNTGRPGVETADWDRKREDAYNTNWFGVTPPTPEDFPA